MKMGNRHDEDLVFFSRVKKSVRKSFQQTPPRAVADFRPSFREEPNPLDGCLNFLEESKPQTR